VSFEDALAKIEQNALSRVQGAETDETKPARLDELRDRLYDATKLDDLPEPEPLIEGVLYRDSLAWLQGKPGSGKSFVALDMACSIATSTDDNPTPWGPDRKAMPGKVIYIIAEGAQGLRQRVDAWQYGNGIEIEPGQLLFLAMPIQLLNVADRIALQTLVSEFKPALIAVDTQARVTVGADENSSKDMGIFVDHLDGLRVVSGACVLVAHHEARGSENLRGSTALEGSATTILRVDKDGPIVTLECKKQKDAAEFRRIEGQLKVEGSSVYWSQNGVGPRKILTNSELAIVGLLRDQFKTTGASHSKLLESSGIAKTTFNRALKFLIYKGTVVNVGTNHHTCYRLAEQVSDEV
jgi:hypothetical protein